MLGSPLRGVLSKECPKTSRVQGIAELPPLVMALLEACASYPKPGPFESLSSDKHKLMGGTTATKLVARKDVA